MRESFLLNLSDLEKMTIQINQGGREKISLKFHPLILDLVSRVSIPKTIYDHYFNCSATAQE